MTDSAPPLQFNVPEDRAGQRLDKALADLLPDFSRNQIQSWIRSGRITVDGGHWRPRDAVRGGEAVLARPETVVDETLTAEPIPLDIVHEDDHLLVVNKPAGLVVHPGAGNREGTLANALLHFDASLEALPRAGIVHRLDKLTSGLLMIARSSLARRHLVEMLALRDIGREYEAVVCGLPTAGGRVDAAIGRHPVDRKRMSVRPDGRPAATEYRLLRRFRAHSHLSLRLESGRTHQIRVHMQHVGLPLLGDPVYGKRLGMPAGATPPLQDALRGFRRQALHARSLSLTHPVTGESLAFSAPPPQDMRQLLDVLARDADAGGQTPR
jgi:23S rRNA pseudouridine1911/1915/1917 synthase